MLQSLDSNLAVSTAMNFLDNFIHFIEAQTNSKKLTLVSSNTITNDLKEVADASMN